MLVLACGCAPKSAEAPAPPLANPDPTAIAPPVESVVRQPEVAEPPAASTPPAVHVDKGWVHNVDDPRAPLIQLVVAESYGDGGAQGVETIVGAAGEILGCWEKTLATEPRRASANIRVRAPSDPAEDPIEIYIGPDTEIELKGCIDAVVRSKVKRPADGDVSIVTFKMFPHRDEVILRRAYEDRVVAVRTGGSCWQWEEEPPCPPNKRCYADRWERTECGHPTMRDSVSARFGLGTPVSGAAPLIDIRLVGGDGSVLWVSPLPSEFVGKYGKHDSAASGTSIAAAPGAFAVKFASTRVTVADSAGLQVFDRRTGDRQLTWAAPPRGERTLWFDGGKYSMQRGSETCQGDANHGAFFAECGDRSAIFDGYTLAVFSGNPPTLVASRHVGQRGNTVSGTAVEPRAVLQAGGVRLTVQGRVFMH